MSKRWDDNEDEDFEFAGGNGGENEFWMEFNQEAANMLDMNRQQEFDIAHKQLNIELMEKAIRVVKGRWFWWLFSSHKTRLKEITRTYRRLVRAVENSL
jgi:hypothetical protein